MCFCQKKIIHSLESGRPNLRGKYMAWRPTEFLLRESWTIQSWAGGWVDEVLGRRSQVSSVYTEIFIVIFESQDQVHNEQSSKADPQEAKRYFRSLGRCRRSRWRHHAGLPPHDYVKYPYIEWYSDRMVVWSSSWSQVKLKSSASPSPIPDEACRSKSSRPEHDELCHELGGGGNEQHSVRH